MSSLELHNWMFFWSGPGLFGIHTKKVFAYQKSFINQISLSKYSVFASQLILKAFILQIFITTKESIPTE